MKSIIVQTKQGTTKIMLSDIYYIVAHPSRPHYVQVKTQENDYDLLQKLKNLEVQFSKELVRCHRSCLVNVSKIKMVNLEKKIILLGERTQYQVVFSRRRYQKIMKKWLNEGES